MRAAAAAEARGRFGGGVPLREGDGEGAGGRGVLDIFCLLSLGGMCVYGVKGEAYEVAKRARVKNCMIADEELG